MSEQRPICVVCLRPLEARHLTICERCGKSLDKTNATFADTIAWAAHRARYFAARRVKR